MDTGIILTALGTVITIIVSTLAIMLTVFKSTVSMINAIHLEIKEINKEMKDFHGRLIEIETENKLKMKE